MVAKVRVALEVNTVRAIAFWKSSKGPGHHAGAGRQEAEKAKEVQWAWSSNPARTLCSGDPETLEMSWKVRDFDSPC